jgi:hypothetical protein
MSAVTASSTRPAVGSPVQLVRTPLDGVPNSGLSIFMVDQQLVVLVARRGG